MGGVSHSISGLYLSTFEYRRVRENLFSGFLPSSDTNRAVQAQKMARGLKFRIYEVEELY